MRLPVSSTSKMTTQDWSNLVFMVQWQSVPSTPQNWDFSHSLYPNRTDENFQKTLKLSLKLAINNAIWVLMLDSFA